MKHLAPRGRIVYTSPKGSGKVHKGAPRHYWCQEYLDDKGRVPYLNPALNKSNALKPGCYDTVMRDGEEIPLCPEHGLIMKKTRFKRVEERMWETTAKTQMTVGGVNVWADTSNRKAKCRLCHGDIDAGEPRLAFEAPNQWRTTTTIAGGVIKSIRHYVHRTCFVDIIMGADHAGDGCPGCTTKLIDDEFQAVKQQILDKETRA